MTKRVPRTLKMCSRSSTSESLRNSPALQGALEWGGRQKTFGYFFFFPSELLKSVF
jgi:hypothetical protein